MHQIVRRPPVTYDATGGGQGATATTFSWNHTITGNCVLAAINLEVYGSTPPTTTAKVGSIPMTQLGFITNYAVGTYCYSAALFGLLNPPTGVQTVSITSSISTYSAANSVSFNDVRSFGSVVTSSGNGGIASVSAAVAPGARIFNAMFNAGWPTVNTFTGYNQTSRYNTTYNYNGLLLGDAPGGPQGFSAGLTMSGYWAAMAVPLD